MTVPTTPVPPYASPTQDGRRPPAWWVAVAAAAVVALALAAGVSWGPGETTSVGSQGGPPRAGP